jgi:hypothetical protein
MVQEPVVHMDHNDAEIDGVEVTLDASTVMADYS